MYRLSNWGFAEFWDGKDVYGFGVVTRHKRFADGTFISTSKVEMLLVKEDRLLMQTYSGSMYELVFEDMDPHRAEVTKAALQKVKSPDKGKIGEELYARCLKLSEEMEQKRRAELTKGIAPGELYLQTSGLHIQHAYFKKEDGRLIPLECQVHSGMYADSILLIETGVVDFRFLPRGGDTVMKPYYWSEGLKALVVENIGKRFEVEILDGYWVPCDKDTVTRIENPAYDSHEDAGQGK